MERRRIGNDRYIDCKVFRGDIPEDFTDKILKVRLVHIYGSEEQISYTIEGNIIKIYWAGANQRRLGQYNLIITENEGEPSMYTADCPALELVAHSKDEGGESCANINVDHISLVMNLGKGADGYTKAECDDKFQAKGSYISSNLVRSIVVLTQKEYDDMAEHVADTLYVIKKT